MEATIGILRRHTMPILRKPNVRMVSRTFTLGAKTFSALTSNQILSSRASTNDLTTTHKAHRRSRILLEFFRTCMVAAGHSPWNAYLGSTTIQVGDQVQLKNDELVWEVKRCLGPITVFQVKNIAITKKVNPADIAKHSKKN